MTYQELLEKVKGMLINQNAIAADETTLYLYTQDGELLAVGE